MEKVIFLDIDGVLNHDEWYKEFFEDGLYTKNTSYDHDISFRSVEKLNMIQKFVKDVSIVITSTWRFDMQDTLCRLNKQGLKIPVIGYTPLNNDIGEYGTCPRGIQIKKWIDDNIKETGDPLLNYVIFDDDDDMLYSQRHNFIQVDPYKGLTDENVAKAIEILGRS